MRKYDENELKEVLEVVRTEGGKKGMKIIFMEMRRQREKILKYRNHLFGMINENNSDENELKNGGFACLDRKFLDVKMRESRLEAKFAGEMLPLLDMEIMIVDEGFEKMLEKVREISMRDEGSAISDTRLEDGDEGMETKSEKVRGLYDYDC